MSLMQYGKFIAHERHYIIFYSQMNLEQEHAFYIVNFLFSRVHFTG